MTQHQSPTGSAYFLDPSKPVVETHVLGVVAENQPGVLARIIGLFAGRAMSAVVYKSDSSPDVLPAPGKSR